MTAEPTPQELALAALLHEAGDYGFCSYDRDCGTGYKAECGGIGEHLIQARVLIALGVLPPGERSPLDVERLARALVTATREQAGEPDGKGWPGYVAFRPSVTVALNVNDLANAIADAYAALAPAQVDNPQSRTLDTASLDWRDAR